MAVALDDIQQKLKLIDQQLAGGENLHKRIVSSCPLLFAAIGLILGISLQETLSLSILIWLTLLAAALFAMAALFFFIKWETANCKFAYLALICFICLGAIRLINHSNLQPDDISRFVNQNRRLASIRGLIITTPRTNDNQNWQFSKFAHTGPGSSFYLKVLEAQTTTGWAKISGTVRVQVSEPVLDLRENDYVLVYCWLDRFKPATNPGQFDISRHMAKKNVFLSAFVESCDGIELLKRGNQNIFHRVQNKLKLTATTALLDDHLPQNQEQALLDALLLGDRKYIDNDTTIAFRKTGLVHLISLSGVHFAILIGLVWWLAKLAGFLKPGRAIIGMAATVVFLMIVPPAAPTLRSAIVCFIFCAAFLFRRNSNSINSLSLAAIILLLLNPTDLSDPGWQLSFAATLGILAFTRPINLFVYEKITNRSWFDKIPTTKPFFRIVSRTGPLLLNVFSVGSAAWIVSTGIVLYHFYTINFLSILWTVITSPLVTAILVLGFLKIIFSLFMPTLGIILGAIINFLSDFLILIVKTIADWNISEIRIGEVPAIIIIAFNALILFAFVPVKRSFFKKAICTVIALVVIGSVCLTKFKNTYHSNLTLTCLDVGHGQAILAQLPGNHNILFDAGSLYNSDIGRKIVVPFLCRNGISKLDAITISHGDIDHLNGIPEIIKDCRIGRIYADSSLLDNENQSATIKFLNKWLSKQTRVIDAMTDDLFKLKDSNIKTLWPDEKTCREKQMSGNDNSLVLLIEFAGKKILLTSDIPEI